MYKKTLRPAIAMIELIFALVIMGIVLMTAPMLISTATKSGYVAIQQEAINAAASQVNMIMGYHWDENSADELYIDPILKVSSPPADAELAEHIIDGFPSGRRLGTPEESYRAFVRSDGQDFTASATLGFDGTETAEDDMDDFSSPIPIHLSDKSGGSATADYIEKTDDINITTAVVYISDVPTSGAYNGSTLSFNPDFTSTGSTSSTNIKRITVTLISSSDDVPELDKEIILHAFSCNIGGYKLEEKDFTP